MISFLHRSSSCPRPLSYSLHKTTMGEGNRNPAGQIGTGAVRKGRTVWSHMLPLQLGIFGQGIQGNGGCSPNPSALGVLGQASGGGRGQRASWTLVMSPRSELSSQPLPIRGCGVLQCVSLTPSKMPRTHRCAQEMCIEQRSPGQWYGEEVWARRGSMH